MIEWDKEAAQVLRSAMKRRRISTKQLVRLLEKEGIVYSDQGLRNRISRGAFNASFLLRCLHLMGVQQLLLEPPQDREDEPQSDTD